MKNTLEGVNSRPRIQKNTSDPEDRIREIMQSEQEKKGGSGGEESTHSAGDSGSIPGEGNSYRLQYSCLENSTDRGAWGATVHGVA